MAEPTTTPFVVVLSGFLRLSRSFSLFLFATLPLVSLSLFLSFSLDHRGTENLDLQKSVRGRTWRSFHPLSALSSLVVSSRLSLSLLSPRPAIALSFLPLLSNYDGSGLPLCLSLFSSE